MKESKAKEARNLFKEEFSKLSSTGMSSEIISCLKETFINAESPLLAQGMPVLSTEVDQMAEHTEERYECSFVGEVPKSIVGLEMPNGKDWLPVIKRLAQRMSNERVESTREVYNLLKAEAQIASRSNLKAAPSGSPAKKGRTS